MEAALILPFFLMLLIGFFSFFLLYASAADLNIQAAAEAKNVAIAVGCINQDEAEEITICKTKELNRGWMSLLKKSEVLTQTAVCRAWIGFTNLKISETYVYATPEGLVYHLQSDCSHLELAIQRTTLTKAKEQYRECERCDSEFGMLVYVTDEGECYHSERGCSGLKRTVRRVALSSVSGRRCCIRCTEKVE